MDVSSNSELLEAWEEAALLAPGRRALHLLCTAGGEDASALAEASVGETDRRLLRLHERLFGRRLEVVGRCPCCRESVECTLDLAAMRLAEPVPVAKPLRVAVLDLELECRLPTALDLDDIRGAGAGAARRLFERCVLRATRNGAETSREALGPDVLSAAGAALGEFDTQAASPLALQCPACGATWRAPLDPGALLWAEFDAWARQLLRDVDRLARAYGWSERDILALSPVRRRHYLELLAS